MKKQILSLLLVVSLITILLSPATPALAATPVMDRYIQVNGISVNQSVITITLYYTFLQSLPSNGSMQINFGYDYAVSQLPGSSTRLTGTVGMQYSKTLSVTDYHSTVRVYLKYSASAYNESKQLTSYYRSTTPETYYHTVTAAEAVNCYIMVSIPGLYLTFAPAGKFVNATAKILTMAGFGVGVFTAAGVLDSAWVPVAGNYMKVTGYFANNNYYESTSVWNTYSSYTKGETPISFSTSYYIP
jgi:hypothetical protein